MQCNCCAVVARLAYLQPAGVAAVASNLQSATQSLLNNGKMKLLENDCQTEAAQVAAATAAAATAWWTYIHMYSACHLVAATYIFEAATQNVWHLGTIFLHRLCLLTRQVAPAPKWYAARVDNQASAYKTQCLHLLWHAKLLSSDVSYADCYVCAWPKTPERMLSYSPNELRISTRSLCLDTLFIYILIYTYLNATDYLCL